MKFQKVSRRSLKAKILMKLSNSNYKRNRFRGCWCRKQQLPLFALLVPMSCKTVLSPVSVMDDLTLGCNLTNGAPHVLCPRKQKLQSVLPSLKSILCSLGGHGELFSDHVFSFIWLLMLANILLRCLRKPGPTFVGGQQPAAAAET